MGEEDPDRYPKGARASVWSVTINTNQYAYLNNLDIYKGRLIRTFEKVFKDRGIYDEKDDKASFISIFTRVEYERRPRMHVHGSVTVVHFGKISMDYEKARAEVIEEMGIGNIYVFIKLSNSPLQFALYARKEKEREEAVEALEEEQRVLLSTRVTRSSRQAAPLFPEATRVRRNRRRG